MKGQPNPEEDPGVEDYVGEEDDDQEAKEVDEEEYLSSMYDDLVAESKEHGGDPDVNFTNVLMERFQSTERKMAKMDAFPEELPVMTDLWNHIQELKDAVARYKFADEKSAKSVVRKRGPTLVAIKKDERTRIMNVQKAKILQILGDDRNRKKLLADLVECEKYFPHTAGVEPTPLKPQKTKRGKRGSGAYQAPQIRDHDYYRGLGEQAQNKMVQSEWKEVWAKEFENMFATNLRPGFRQLQMRKTIEDVVFPNWFARYGDSKIKPSDILKTSQGKSYSTENKAVAARFGKHFKLPPFMKGTRGDPGHTYRVDFVKALKGSDLRYEQYKEQHSQKPEPVPEPKADPPKPEPVPEPPKPQPKAAPPAKPISPEDAEKIYRLKHDISATEQIIRQKEQKIEGIRRRYTGKWDGAMREKLVASVQRRIKFEKQDIIKYRAKLRALEAKYESPKPEPKPKPQPKPQPLKFQSVKKHLNPGEAGMFLRNYTGVQTSSPGEEARSYANQIIDEAFPALKVKVDVGRIISPVLQSIVNQREGWGKTIEVPLENKGPFSDMRFEPFSGKANLEKWIKKLETSQLYRKLANISKPETEEVLDLTGGGDEEKEEQISTKQLLEDSRCLQALTKDVKDKSQRISKVIQDDTNQLYTRMSDLEEVMKKWDNFPLHKYGQEVLQASTRSKHILKDTEEGNNTLFEAIGEIILEKLIQDTGNFETIMLQPGDIDVLKKFQESDSFVVKNVADRMLKFSNRLPITSDQKRGRAITGITGAQEFAKTGATRQQTTKPVQPRVHIPTSQKDTTPPTSPRVRPVASPERQRAMRDVQNSQRRIDNLIEMGKRPRLSPFEAVKIRQDIEQERHNKKQLEKKRDLIPEPLERPPSPQEVTAPPVRQGPTQPGRAPPPGRIPPPPVQRVPAPRRRNIPPPPTA